MSSSRLWPVATSLVVLLSGSLAVEFAARNREAETLRIEIVDAELANADGDLESFSEAPTEAASEAQQLARQAAKRGDYERALGAYSTLVQEQPDNALLITEYAHWLSRAGQPGAAKESLVHAKSLAPNDPRVALELGFVQRRLGNADAAVSELGRALELRPNHSATRIALGNLLRQQERFVDAIAVLEPAASSGSNEERARALTVLGRCHMARGAGDRARPLLREAVERAPASVNTWLGATYGYLESKAPADVEVALAHALRVTKLAPELGLGYRLLGRIHELRDQSSDAKAAYRRSLTFDPNSRSTRKRVLRLSLDDDDLKVAHEQAQALLKLAPQVATYHFLAGLVEARQGHAQAAIVHYQSAIDLKQGHHPEAWFNLGKAHSQAANVSAALAAYQRATAEKPDYFQAWNNLGRVYLDAGDPAQALQCFERALVLRPDYSLGWHNLARLHYKQGRFEESAHAYAKAVGFNPKDRALMLKYAIALRKAGDEQAAIDTYHRLLDKHPRYVTAWFNLGVALAANSRLNEARQAYHKALELAPNHAKAMKNLGYLEAKTGHAEKARVYLSDALDHDPKDEDTRLKLAELHLAQLDKAACRSEAERVLAQNQNNLSARSVLARCGE